MTSAPTTISPWPHRLAVLLVCATFPLIWIGGLVTTTGAGMAFPKWLTIDGRFFLFYPLERWLAGPWDQFIEHGHRLPATVVGLLTILLAAVLWRSEPRRWVRWTGVGAVAAVSFQGLLGGLRVDLNQQVLAMIHGCVGPLFFGLTVALAAFTSHWWGSAGDYPVSRDNGKLIRLTVATAALAYLQLVTGAWLRHLAATASGEVFRVIVVFHLLVAAAVLGHVLYLGHLIWWSRPRNGLLIRPALALILLVLAQVALGGGTWVTKYGWPAWLAEYDFAQRYVIVPGSPAQTWTVTAHVAIGSLILATAVLIAVRLARLSYASQRLQTTRPAAHGLAEVPA